MASLKALGPDWLPPLFYQRYWLVVGPDVTLIPKVKNLERVTEFCSISFCNVINKLVSKVIANRLKTILPKILSASQSAFVLGRLITHNVLIAFETLHHMHTTKIGRDGAMALKPDMSKAYDRVEWIYLEFIMRKMGFHPRWVSMIMMCISTVSYSLLVNGEPMVILIPLVGYAKGILYHHICLYCVQKNFILLLHRLPSKGIYKEFPHVGRGPRLHTSSLQNITCSFPRPFLEIVRKFKRSSQCMTYLPMF